MNRNYLSTGLWLLTAGLTFALGWYLRPAPGTTTASSEDLIAPVGQSAEERNVPAKAESTDDGSSVNASAGPALDLKAHRVLSSGDIEKLGEQFKTSLDPIDRRLAFAELLEGLTADNALAIRAQIEHLNAESREFQEFHYAWGKVGGTEAILHGAETSKPDMVATLAGWTSADPNAAREWFNGLDRDSEDKGDFSTQEYLKRGMVHGLANTDTDRAARFVYELASAGDDQAPRMLGIVTGSVMRANGVEGAAEWASNLPDGDLRTSAMGHTAHAFARQDPEAAAEWAGRLGGDNLDGRIVSAISSQWARRDGEAAVSWLETLGNAPGQTEAYRATFEGWADRNPAAASEYLAEMPQSPARDQAITGLVNRHRWEDPVASIVWAESIQSERTRLEALTRAGQAWTRRDPAAAAEWAASSGLPENLQQAIINPPRKDKR